MELVGVPAYTENSGQLIGGRFAVGFTHTCIYHIYFLQ